MVEFKTWSGAVEIPAELLVLTDWNINKMSDSAFATLIDEIREYGFDEPCQVVAMESGQYLVVGGEHRYKAGISLEMKHIPCVIKDIAPEDRVKMIDFSIRRNNIRGKIQADRLAEVELEYSKKRKMSVEETRDRLFIKGEILKGLRRNSSIVANEDDGKDKGGRAKQRENREAKSEESDEESKKPEKKSSGEPRAPEADPIGVGNAKKATVLALSMKILRQEILDDHGDTIEHGYVYFGQGDKQHLIVEETPALYSLISRMVAAVKSESAGVNEFLTSAIQRELKEWE